MNPVGLAVTLRVRMSAADANQSNGSVSPARILALFSDAATELMIRLDGDEGSLRALQQVELLAPVYVGDYIEATGVLTKIG
ncbi:MAG TPA: hotdog fold domain-containing protein, partial [Polyangiaceae bacterium]|nr:hotdog fold domain-containing protein [Polyangiaceae bacterium]